MERANELYWGSERSVNQIADDLELSKGALYGIIEPEATGLACPLCGDEVVYANRTAKEKGMLDCPSCEWDGDTDETVDLEDSAVRAETESTDGDLSSTDSSGADAGASAEGSSAPDLVPPRPLTRPAASTVAGGALLGAAVGLALVMWARRR